MAVHSTVAQMQKLDGNIIEALRTGEAIADSKLEALRKFVQKVVEKRGWLEESEVDSFLSAGYSRAQLLEAVVGIAQKTLSNYINHIVKTPLDSAFEPNKWEKALV
jgi:alkylhydroperoxidase family enzyme